MRPFVLLGIDKYHRSRLICIVFAEDMAAAASKLGGKADGRRVVGENDPCRLEADLGEECAAFSPGNCTHEILAAASRRTDRASALVAYYRYGTDNIYRRYALVTAPEVG